MESKDSILAKELAEIDREIENWKEMRVEIVERIHQIHRN